MKYLIVVNELPYSNEKPYNALRITMSLNKSKVQKKICFLDDGVVCAMKDQKTLDCYFNLKRMIKSVSRKNGAVYLCTSCMNARG